jgi:hypothetical protein
MKWNIIINLVLVFSFVSSMVIYFSYSIGKKNKLLEQLSEEYTSLSIEQSLEGTVTNIYHPYPQIFNDDPLHAYLVLDDSIKRRIKTGHELAESFSLDSILGFGDLLIKKSGSDSILIYKVQNMDTLKYCFQLRDDLGYPLKRIR